MARVETPQASEWRADRSWRRLGGPNGLVAAVLVVLALGTTAEVTARRWAASPPPAAAHSSWQAVLHVAEEARARGDVAAARRAYLTALFRARGAGSLAGVLGATEGFAALGDGEVVERALQMAAALDPAAEPVEVTGLQALRDRLATRQARPKAVHDMP